MKTRSLTLTILAALCSAVLPVACVGESTPHMVTETGNPPVVERDRIRVTLDDEVATVTGSSGAVPKGTNVRVENARTGDGQSVNAEADGSFAATVPAIEGDSIEIEVTDDDGTRRLELEVPPPVQPTEPSDEGGAPGGSCEEMGAALRVAYAGLGDGVDKACTQDSDCVKLSTPLQCYTWACSNPTPISVAGQAEVDARLPGIDAQCEAMLASGCEEQVTPCPMPFPSEVACIDGVCAEDREAEQDASCSSQQAQIRDAVDALVADARGACSEDADCVYLKQTTLSCVTQCDTPAAISADQQAAFEAAHAALESEFCPAFDACPKVTSDCSEEPEMAAVCADSACTLIPAEVSEEECFAAAEESAEQLKNFISELDNSCTTDDDCTFSDYGTSCSAGCPEAPVAVANLEAIDAKRAEVSSEICGEFTTEDCSSSCPDIDLFPNGVGCVEGQCGAKPDDTAD